MILLWTFTVLVAAMAQAQDVCPKSISNWLYSTEAWPQENVTLANRTYGPAELVALLADADGHDASLLLASELAATQLNLAAGVETENPIHESSSLAASLLDGLMEGLPGHVDPGGEGGQQMMQAAGPLAEFNHAEGMPECEETFEARADAPGYRRGVMLVRYTPELASTLREAWLTGEDPVLPASLAALHQSYGVTSVEPLFDPQLTSESAIQATRERYPERTKRTPSGADTESHLGDLFELWMGEQIEIEAFAGLYAQAEEVVYAEPDKLAWAFFTPNDTYFNPAQLWGLYQVEAETAWDTATGLGVVVAVIDSGVDTSHPDLAANIWSGVGWDFVDNDAIPQDGNGHGTHVAGTIAAVGDNALGVVGLAFDAEIMALRALNDGGIGFVSDLSGAIVYAINQGADIINNSWGGFGTSATIESAINDAQNMGILVVSAAGNDTADPCLFFPANVENSMTVSSFTSADVKAGYSNFGVKVDVAAPGGLGGPSANLNASNDVLSTSPPVSTIQNSGVPVLTGGSGEKYMPLAGTSMAAPHVAALAALLIDEYDPTIEKLKQGIRQTAADVATAGFDLDSGHGRIDAAAALAVDSTEMPSSSIVSPKNCARVEGQVPVMGTSVATPFPDGYFDLLIGEGQLPTTFPYGISSILNINNGQLHNLDTETVADGWATIRLQTFDTDLGTQGEDRNVVAVDNVYISQPAGAATLSGSQIQVMGRASGQLGFNHYVLEYAPGFDASGIFTPINTSYNQVSPAGVLGTWNYSSLSDGGYTLRLRALFSSHLSMDTKNVVIDRSQLNGWPATVQHMPGLKSPQVADLDGDGQNEVIYGASVFEANGTVKAGWTNQPGIGRTNSAILDIDGDGDLEVLAVDDNPSCAGPRELSAYNPDRSTDWCYTLPNAIASTVSAGDVDGDGQDEAVVAISPFLANQTTVHVLDAASGSLESSFSTTGTSWSSVALADLDQDGSRDLVFATWTMSGSGETHVVDASGSALPGWPATNAGLRNQDPVVGDIDGDGRFEVIIGSEAWNHDGSPLTGWPSVHDAMGGGAIVPLKDADCAQEVVKATEDDYVFSVHDHDGTLKHDRERSYNESGIIGMFDENGAAGNPIVADVDGDGEVEIVRPSPRGNDGETPVPIYGSETLSDVDPPGFPKFIHTLHPDGFSDVIRATAAVADLDGNGLADLISAGGGKIHVWNLGVPLSPTDPWPMFQRDLQNTGTQPLERTVQITGGNLHLVALTERGRVRTAGDNSYAQLGDGTTTNSSVPVDAGLCGIQKVASSLNHSLALHENGLVFGWGKNLFGHVGNGTTSSHQATPVLAWPLTNVVEIATGAEFSMALEDDGTVWAWGDNSFGQLGNGSFGGFSTTPAQVPGLQNVVAISGADGFAMALRSDGTVWTWGSNLSGKLGNGSSAPHSTQPVQASITNVVAIDGGGLHAMALRSDGTVWAWGDNSLGQLGNGSSGGSSNVPIQVSGLSTVQSVAAGRWHSAALRSDGTVWTWGSNSSGQLGIGTTTSSNAPVQVTGLPMVSELSSGYLDTMVIDQTGTVWVWGSNLKGQLGNGTTTHSLVPIQTQF